MKLKKGSAAAKAYMAKLRAAKGKSKAKAKKVGAVNDNLDKIRDKVNNFLNPLGYSARVEKSTGDILYIIEPSTRKTGNKRTDFFDGMQIIALDNGTFEVSEYQAGINENELHIYKITKSLTTALKELIKGNKRKPIRVINGIKNTKKVGTTKKAKSRTTKKIGGEKKIVVDLKKLNDLQDEYFYNGKYREIREDMEGRPYIEVGNDIIILKKPVSLKKRPKKVNKKIGSKLKLHKKETRLGATPKDFKTRSKTYHKDTKSHNVNIRVMSGINNTSINEVKRITETLEKWNKVLSNLEIEKKHTKELWKKKVINTDILRVKNVIKDLKKNLSNIKKHIK